MVTYCALCIVQSIGSSPANALSDWSLLRLATLQELVSLLEAQVAGRHEVPTSTGTNVLMQWLEGFREKSSWCW